MGCGCGRGKQANSVFVATDKIGQQFTFKTEIEARAYLARHGGGGAVTQKELSPR